MKKAMIVFAVSVVLLSIAFGAGWWVANQQTEQRIERVVAMKWADGKYGTAFYGAEVYLVPAEGGFSMRGRVHIGRGNGHFHDLGDLGTVKTAEDAVRKCGTIEFKPDGLHIGDGTVDNSFLSLGKLESHR